MVPFTNRAMLNKLYNHYAIKMDLGDVKRMVYEQAKIIQKR